MADEIKKPFLEGKYVRFWGATCFDRTKAKIEYGQLGIIENDMGKYLLIRFGKNLFDFPSLNGLTLES